MPQPRKPRKPTAPKELNVRDANDITKLTGEQRRLLQRITAADKKVQTRRAAYEGAIAARNDLVVAAAAAGVGQTLLARTLGVERMFIWKIVKGTARKPAGAGRPPSP